MLGLLHGVFSLFSVILCGLGAELAGQTGVGQRPWEGQACPLHSLIHRQRRSPVSSSLWC